MKTLVFWNKNENAAKRQLAEQIGLGAVNLSLAPAKHPKSGVDGFGMFLAIEPVEDPEGAEDLLTTANGEGGADEWADGQDTES